MSIFNFQFSIFKRAVTWLAIIGLAVPFNLLSASAAFAAPAALGGGAQGGATVNGTGALVPLSDLTLLSQANNDFDSAGGISITSSTNTLAGLNFDTAPMSVTADPSGNLDLGAGNGNPVNVTPAAASITIPVITASSQIGDSVVVSGIKVKATASGTASSYAGAENLIATSAGGAVGGSPITVDAQTPTLPTVTIASNNSDPAYAKTGDTVTITIVASEPITMPVVTINGNGADAVNQTNSQNYTATRVMQAGDAEVPVTFTVDFSDLNNNAGAQVTATTNGSSVTFDKTAPTINSRETQDGNGNGKIDALKITMSEPVKDSTFNFGEWAVAGYTVSGISTGVTANDSAFNLDLTESGTADTDATPTITYTPSATLTDLASNALGTSSVASTDKAKAVMTVATTAVNTSNVPTRINITLSEDIASGTVSGADFTVAGHTISSASRVSAKTIRITLTTASALTTGETPLTTIVGSINDLAASPNSTTSGSITPADGVAPRLNADGDSGLLYIEGANGAVEQLEVGFTESVGTPGFNLDHTVSYDPDGTFVLDGDERSIAVSNNPGPAVKSGDSTKVVLTIPDQSQQTDGGGKFKVTVSSNVKDLAGNGIDQNAGLNDAVSGAVTFDSIAPTVALSSSASNPTNSSPIPITAQFSESVTGFTSGDAAIGNGSVSNFIAVDQDTYTFDITPTGQGAVTVDVGAGVAQDGAGNQNIAAAQLARTYDSVAPVVTVTSPIEGELVASATPVAAYSGTDTNSLTYEVKLDGVAVAGHTSGATLGTLSNGAHTLEVTAIDAAGNRSATITRHFTTNSQLQNVSVNLQYPAGTTNALIDDTATSGVVLDGINTSGEVTISIGQYQSAPDASRLSGVSAFGKHFEITASDISKITFPLMIKIYYKQTDLDAVGITEDKLDGIYFYNVSTGKYERYSDTGVNTANVMVGAVQFAGYVFANADHLTPVIAAYDSAAPGAPQNIKVATSDGKATVSWDKVSDASAYQLRWRQSNTSDSYTKIDVSASTVSYEVTGLENGVEYEFGVAAKDRVGNLSGFASANGTPNSLTVALTAAPKKTAVSAPTESFETLAPPAAPSVEVKPSVPTPEEGKIKGSETEPSGTSPAATIAILLLALAAGVGGYYGYEWWLARSSEKSSSQKTAASSDKVGPRKSRKPTRRNGRW